MTTENHILELKELLVVLTAAAQKCHAHRNTLATLIIEDCNAVDKLQKIKVSILKYRSENGPKEENKERVQEGFNSMNLPNIPDNHLNIMLDLLSHATEPIKKHNLLLDSIGELLRADKLEDKKKVDRIGNLLV